MKKKNIYTNQSQELLTLFEEAGNGAKVMCVPIDYAKKDHGPNLGSSLRLTFDNYYFNKSQS